MYIYISYLILIIIFYICTKQKLKIHIFKITYLYFVIILIYYLDRACGNEIKLIKRNFIKLYINNYSCNQLKLTVLISYKLRNNYGEIYKIYTKLQDIRANFSVEDPLFQEIATQDCTDVTFTSVRMKSLDVLRERLTAYFASAAWYFSLHHLSSP